LKVNINEIQNEGHRHLELISGDYFLTYCRLYIVAFNRRTEFRTNIPINDWIMITFKVQYGIGCEVFPFLRASAMLKHVIDIGWTSVCPSVRPSDGVRPSVTRWYCIKTAEYIVMLSSPHVSPFILVLCVSRSSRNSNGVTPAGPLNRGGVWKCRNFRPITCYIIETVEDKWVHAARRLTSTEFSFDPCNIYRD